MAHRQFIVRRALPTDANGIAVAHIDSIRSLGAKSYPREIIDEWGAPRSGAAYEKAMENDEVFFVAIEAGAQPEGSERILGFSSYRLLDGKHRTAVYVAGSQM